MPNINTILINAQHIGLAVPAFNVPYLPMVEPVVRAVVDSNSLALIETARLEWLKFEAGGPKAVAEVFYQVQNPDHVRLHLDHIPAIDEDGQRVDALGLIQEAIDLGYHSVMIDGSRLPLSENIAITQAAVELAHTAGIPCEAELGAVLGHESGPLPPYEALFASRKGFTDLAEARTFVAETGCDWLSVAVGNLHGAIAAGVKDQKKVAARLDLDHLAALSQAVNIPLVLHGGSGIPREIVLAAFKSGIAKINVGTEIRQVYETILKTTGSVTAAQEAVHRRTCDWITAMELADTQPLITQEAS